MAKVTKVTENDDSDWGLGRGIVIHTITPTPREPKTLTVELDEDILNHLIRTHELQLHVLTVLECEEDLEAIERTEAALAALRAAK